MEIEIFTNRSMEGVLERACFQIPWVFSVCPANNLSITQHVGLREGLLKARNDYDKTEKSVS